MKKSTYTAKLSTFNRACYQLAWRWHFYAGLFVIPFLLVLSMSGMVMLYDEQIQTLRYSSEVLPSTTSTANITKAPIAPSILLTTVQKSYPTAVIKKYIPAKGQNLASFVVIKQAQETLHIAINPYTGELLAQINRDNSFYAWANDIHGSLLIGEVGDHLMEIAAGLMVLLLLSGLYMWLPSNNKSQRAVFWPKRHKGKRVFYRELHSALGFYSSLIMLFFIISGLSWTGVWGSKIVQAWSSFPMLKSASVPLSTLPHSSLNQGVMEEIPWNLEQTLLPQSTLLSTQVAHKKIGIDQIAALASSLTMQQYQVRMPLSERAVYTLSASTMGGDITDPRLDRTVHIDQYSGKILADIGWDKYSPMAKFMAAGIGLHQGGLGIVNLLVNTLVCLVMLVISVTAILMWWARKPEKYLSLNAPVVLNNSPLWKFGLVAVVVIAVLFPLTGVAISLFVIADLLLKTIKMLRTRRLVSK
ncbi:MAG: PepSY domain-containing protein [Oceanospirillaceae bacterium]